MVKLLVLLCNVNTVINYDFDKLKEDKMKYNIGDYVRLRDDLIYGKKI